MLPLDPVPDIEERAAIMQYDGGLSRREAEDSAAQGQGFRDAAHYRQVLADYVVSGRLK
jgi:hypothetical protein